MFPDEIVECVYKLRNLYKGRKHCVSMSYPIIEIFRYWENREISVKLFYFADTKTIEIQPLDQKYFSKISFYDYDKPEKRWVRNKDLMFSIIRDLKRSGLWDFVTNKEFIIINSFNKKTDPTILIKTLNKLVK